MRRDLDVADQETQPIDTAAVASAIAFANYLTAYQLDPLHVAVTAKVRYLTIWNMQHGKPIQKHHAVQVRNGLQS